MRVPILLGETLDDVIGAVKNITKAMANALTISENSQVTITVWTFTLAATNYDIPHTLGRIPVYFTAEPEVTGTGVYASAANRSAWTATTIRLQCNTAAAVVHLVIG